MYVFIYFCTMLPVQDFISHRISKVCLLSFFEMMSIFYQNETYHFWITHMHLWVPAFKELNISEILN